MLRWGIVSTGRMCEWFCGDFGSVTNGNLSAVCSRELSRAKAFAKQFEIPRAYGSYAELLADPQIDIIYIGTPHTKHHQNVLDGLAAGKNIVCEKPFATSVAHTQEMISAAAAAGRYVMEAMWTWYLPALQKAKSWIDEGRIGDLVHIKTDFGYPVPYAEDMREYDANDAGGALREMGIYPIGIARYFYDDFDTPLSHLSVIHDMAPNGVENDLTAIYRLGGVTINVATSFKARLRNSAHIIGTEGYIIIQDGFRAHQCGLFQLDEQVDAFNARRTERGYHYQAVAAGEDVSAGRQQSPIVPLRATLALQQDMAAILTATGRGEA